MSHYREETVKGGLHLSHIQAVKLALLFPMNEQHTEQKPAHPRHPQLSQSPLFPLQPIGRNRLSGELHISLSWRCLLWAEKHQFLSSHYFLPFLFVDQFN